ncbi:MAG: hypothetical protein PHH14_03755 [Candidatus Margulisbacteria bacterium]|nr:hypothetical protein [Candidatus Margulisiibacteriota bacterium]
MSIRNKIIIILVMTCFLQAGSACFTPAQAQKKAAAEEVLTKGDAVMMLSATDFMKKKIGELLSWTVGYDVSKVSRVKLTPSINYVKALPKRVPPDGRTVIELQASVDDPSGLKNIAGVRADLSSIGRLSNMMLVDNGLFGDETPGDGVFTLQTSVSPQINIGNKDIAVAVSNKKGWLALAKTSLEVKKDPSILEARFLPDRVLAESGNLVTITVRVENPGRLIDIQSITADLSALQLSARESLYNTGEDGDLAAGDDTWTLQFALPKGAPVGTFTIPLQVTNLVGGLAIGEATITVYK